MILFEIPQIDYDDEYLGIHINRRGNMSGTTIKKLEIITESPLKAQQKDIISMPVLL